MLDIVQLHGSEPVEWGKWISGSGGVGVIKVFHVPAAPAPVAVAELPSKENGDAEKAALDGDKPAPKAEPVVQTARVTPESLSEYRMSGYHNVVLLDSIPRPPPSSATTTPVPKALSGGSGVTMDWTYARAVVEAGEAPSSSHHMPIMLAGGLNPSNVAAAVEAVHPWCVDVSSGVELGGEKGVRKDHDKVRAFIRAAKGLDVVEAKKVEAVVPEKADVVVVE